MLKTAQTHGRYHLVLMQLTLKLARQTLLNNNFQNSLMLKTIGTLFLLYLTFQFLSILEMDLLFGLTGSFNKITRWVNKIPNSGNTYEVVNPGNLNYYAIDGTISYSFMNMLKSKVVEPSAHIGGGYTFMGDASAGTLNGGLGLTFWFAKNVGLSFSSTYKYSFDDTRVAKADVPTHVFHQAGIKFKFGAKDTDNDGVIDKEDSCPTVAGVEAFKGCPDTDLDGIQDSEDACPTEAGTPEMNGCPDRDGDGVADGSDACPDDAGIKILGGCPDTDGDGVADKMTNVLQ